MKQIIVKSCGECPHETEWWDDDTLTTATCTQNGADIRGEIASGTIHKDCPLQEMPSREEAEKLILYYAEDIKDGGGNIGVEDVLDKLGFGKEEGK